MLILSHPLSRKLFTGILEELFKSLAVLWEDRDMVISDKRLTYFPFSQTTQEFELMLQELSTTKIVVG